ncbi:hypothetical protein NUM3379_25160 [Kineococcus sp. NUM-3379]
MAVPVDVSGVPQGPVGEGGWRGVQLVNAAHVMNAAAALGLDRQAQQIGVMTAMGESTLRVVDHGDRAGPDSRGLFQQRANGAWGSYADRMDPFTSATNFFRALQRVAGWRSLPPTLAAHRTQRNADPDHYAKHHADAVAVVAALSAAGVGTGTQPTALPAAATPAAGPAAPPAVVPAGPDGAVPCPGTDPAFGPPADLPAGAWVLPTDGPVTSSFGMRRHPISGVVKVHTGTDYGPGCDAPIRAAAAGTVVQAGPARGYGNLVVLEHAGGVLTRYAHMYARGVLVRVGQQVPAGHVVGLVGSAGSSTACHLHLEVKVGGDFTDPVTFLRGRTSTA